MKANTNEIPKVYSLQEKNNNTSGNYAGHERQSSKHKSDSKEEVVNDKVYYELLPHTYLKTLQAMADEDRPE